ncbi:MAG: SipW-dependent-type signal peptide-containing protein [Lachnospiraceae bacterium]|nr:SipW-dependent-type signal peptide-containing protein [Lachnospiraceae bacterium]
MKKQIIAGMAAAMICVGAIGGTLAYLTDTSDQVRNTFTVGQNVDISLDEKYVDKLGDELKQGDVNYGKRGNGNVYKLVPNESYIKDPTVHVLADTEPCYVFIKVTDSFSNYNLEPDDTTYKSITAQIEDNWTEIVVDGAATTDKFYYYKGANAPDNIVTPSKTEKTDLVVFSNFKIKNTTDYDELAAAKDATILIEACAIQADGFASVTAAAEELPDAFIN